MVLIISLPQPKAGFSVSKTRGQGPESVATTQLTATLDTADALSLDATLTDLATLLGRLGDPTGIDIRRAHALGILADPQHALNLLTHTHIDTGTNRDSGGDRDGATDAAPATGAAAGVGVVVDESTPTVRTAVTGWRPTRPRAVLYVHVSAADLATGTGGAWIEKLGPITLDLLATWLHATNGGTGAGAAAADDGSGPADSVGPAGSRGFGGFTVRPVLDLTAHRVCDVHDPPPVMREQVILRDRHCVFPGCRVDARDCDLDHIAPYVPLDQGGPPGQTHPDALACLCRRHHRLKTFTAWTYHRTTHGRYQWTSPHGHTYLT